MTLHTLVLILHVLGAGVLIGICFFALVLVISPAWSAERLQRIAFIARFGVWAAGWQLLTGLYLASSDWDELHNSKLFWTKMVLFVIQGAVAGGLLRRKVKQAMTNPNLKPSFPIYTLSILIIGIVSIGVMIIEA